MKTCGADVLFLQMDNNMSFYQVTLQTGKMFRFLVLGSNP